MPSIPIVTANIAASILVLLIILQIHLFRGYPLGHYAWGGAHKVLPTKLRIASAVSIFIYLFIITVILDRSGAYNIYTGFIHDYGIWILTAYFALGIFLNGISRSLPERKVMTPVAAALTVLCLITALSS